MADTKPELDTLFASLSLNDVDSDLVDELLTVSKDKPKLVKSTQQPAPAEPSILIRSWKMNEFKYYDIPSPFPTLARGLFTQDITDSNGNTKHRIVARGYDKFFNIGEVPWTHWAAIESHTAAPYTLTHKSNGCIIFVAALTPSKVLVTSKHSLGIVQTDKSDAGEPHARVGERHLRKHLAAAGKTEEQLAQTLWDKNWTAAFELCDDSFEEHVLPYGPEKTGLHLHGLNSCTREFATQEQPVVDAFAAEWGFIPTPSTVLNTVPEVRAFTEEVGRTGRWNGEALEGFVVRTHVTEPPTKGNTPASKSPYPPGASFFFKIKFDEPYMMYRDWREVTKSLLGKGATVSSVPKTKMRRAETKLYVRWAIAEINRDRAQFKDFQRGRGIIAARERFLAWMESEEGKRDKEKMDAAPEERALSKPKNVKFGKTIIVPVAIPGVGKTAVAVALQHLFGFGHVQSDDVRAKKAAPIFIKNVMKALESHDVVIADKNNHLKDHRSQLRDAVANHSPPVRLLALNWAFELPLPTIHRLCVDRVLQRGPNHQSLVPVAADAGRHEDIIWRFLKDADELTPDEVDESVEMDVEESLEDAVARAVDACVRILGVPRPDAERVGQALAAARGYAPKSLAKPPPPSQKDGKRPPRYFGILVEADLRAALEGFLHAPGAHHSGLKFWERLKKGDRVTKRPHVTIVHSKALEDPVERAVWDRCLAATAAAARAPMFNFKLGHAVWNDRIMAVTVDELAASTDEEVAQEAVEFVGTLPPAVRERLHVTVGTRDGGVPPVEAKELVALWRRNGGKDSEEVKSVPLADVWAKGPLRGLQT